MAQAVPSAARRILEVRSRGGRLAERLKSEDPSRTVSVMEPAEADGLEAPVTTTASGKGDGRSTTVDRYFDLDLLDRSPDVAQPDVLDPGSVDCLILTDVLERTAAPERLLERLRPLLAPDGSLLCSVSNIQYHRVVSRILRGDFQYQPSGPLEHDQLRFFTFATVMKLLLDTGFEPDLFGTVEIPGGAAILDAVGPVLAAVRADPDRSIRYLRAARLLVSGRPRPVAGRSPRWV